MFRGVVFCIYTIILLFLILASPALATDPPVAAEAASQMPWWAWPLILFVVTFFSG